jgi:hypothetical protein
MSGRGGKEAPGSIAPNSLPDPFAPLDGIPPAVGRSTALNWLGGGEPARRRLADMLRSRELQIAMCRVLYRPSMRTVRFGTYLAVPSPQSVCQAYALERGWRMAPGCCQAQNDIGLSTQVPARLIVAMQGCHETVLVYGGRILLEPAPDWVFGFGPAAVLLIQGTRLHCRENRFQWPYASGWDTRPMSMRQAVRTIASRLMPLAISSLQQDAPRMPHPYRGLARQVIRQACENAIRQ